MRRLLLLALFLLAAWMVARGPLADSLRDAKGMLSSDERERHVARVTHVRDGDTIEVRVGGRERVVRLLGIDTPESVKPGTPVECGSLQAKDLLLRLVFTRPRDTDDDGLADRDGGRGRRVVLVSDVTQDDEDRFGRRLRYARVRGAERTLQERLLTAGWAAVYVFDDRPFARFDRFVAAARSAKRGDKGVYARCGGDFHRPARR